MTARNTRKCQRTSRSAGAEGTSVSFGEAVRPWAALGLPVDHLLRCHLYRETLGARAFSLVTPRPRDGLSVSTNRYHETWHLISAPHHVPTLRALVWAAAHDRHADTIYVLSGASLEPTPFDAAPSLPVVIACSDRVHLRKDDVRSLLGRLRRRRRPDGTVKLRSFGLRKVDAASADEQRERLDRERRSRRSELRVERMGGAIVFHGTAAALRYASITWQWLEQPLRPGDSAHEYVDRDWRRWPEGEVQVFADYERMLADARVEREQVIRNPGCVPPHALGEVICERRAARAERRQELERRRYDRR